jgi:hypothetical protein
MIISGQSLPDEWDLGLLRQHVTSFAWRAAEKNIRLPPGPPTRSEATASVSGYCRPGGRRLLPRNPTPAPVATATGVTVTVRVLPQAAAGARRRAAFESESDSESDSESRVLPLPGQPQWLPSWPSSSAMII